jgi:hypothetical protein
MNHFEEFRKETEAMCQRITGKTVDEWDAVFAKRRANGLRAGKLSPDRIMSEKEADGFMRYYGLSDGDIERVLLKKSDFEVPMPYDLKEMEKVVCRDQEKWGKFDEQHQHSYLGPMKPELLTVIAYRPVADLNNRRFE